MNDSTSDENVDKELDATFDKLETGEFPTLNDNAEPMTGTSNEKELQANVAELLTRLSLTEESYAVAIKERDAADEARRKLERTLAEFLTRFASVRETQSAAFKEVEKLGDVRRDNEKKLATMSAELTATQEARSAAQRSRDEALAKQESQQAAVTQAQDEASAAKAEVAQARSDAEQAKAEAVQAKAEVEQARIQLERFQEMAVQSLEPLSQEQSRTMKTLIEETEGVIDEAVRVREEMEKVIARAEDLKSNIASARRDMGQKLATVLGSPAALSGTRDAVASASSATPVVAATPSSSAEKTQAMAAVGGE